MANLQYPQEINDCHVKNTPLTIHFILPPKSPTNSLPYSARSTNSIIVKFNTKPLTRESFNTPQRVRTSLVSPLHGIASLQICQVNITPLIFQTSLVNSHQQMTNSQNCSYRKSTTVRLTSHL